MFSNENATNCETFFIPGDFFSIFGPKQNSRKGHILSILLVLTRKTASFMWTFESREIKKVSQ